MQIRLPCLAVLLAAVVSVSAQNRAPGLATALARARHLQHGINASEWFAQSNDYSAVRTNRYTDAQDIALMAKLGFDSVRLSIDPAPLEQDPLGADGLNAYFTGRLDRALEAMLADGLAVIVDIHPRDSYKQQLRASNEAVDRLEILWRKLAAHYAGRDPDRVFFEILNEPEVNDRYRWSGIQARLADAIRQAAPRQTIIAAGANYSDIPDLLGLQPLEDANVIYYSAS